MQTPILRSLFGQTNEQVQQSDIVMLLTPHIVRTHELTVAGSVVHLYRHTAEHRARRTAAAHRPIAGSRRRQRARQPRGSGRARWRAQWRAALRRCARGRDTSGSGSRSRQCRRSGRRYRWCVRLAERNRHRCSRESALAAAGASGATPPPFQGEGGQAPGAAPAGGQAPGVVPPGGQAPASVTPAAPPRDPNATPPVAPGAAGSPPTSPGAAQVFVTPPGTEFRIAGGPYTVPLSINNASRVSVITLTVTFNPNVLRVRTVQDGTFMRQGSVRRPSRPGSTRPRDAWTSPSRARLTRRAHRVPGSLRRCSSMPSDLADR